MYNIERIQKQEKGCGTSLCRWVVAEGYTRPNKIALISWPGVAEFIWSLY